MSVCRVAPLISHLACGREKQVCAPALRHTWQGWAARILDRAARRRSRDGEEGEGEAIMMEDETIHARRCKTTPWWLVTSARHACDQLCSPSMSRLPDCLLPPWGCIRVAAARLAD